MGCTQSSHSEFIGSRQVTKLSRDNFRWLGEDKEVHTFPKDISLKVNIIECVVYWSLTDPSVRFTGVHSIDDHLDNSM